MRLAHVRHLSSLRLSGCALDVELLTLLRQAFTSEIAVPLHIEREGSSSEWPLNGDCPSHVAVFLPFCTRHAYSTYLYIFRNFCVPEAIHRRAHSFEPDRASSQCLGFRHIFQSFPGANPPCGVEPRGAAPGGVKPCYSERSPSLVRDRRGARSARA